MKIGSIVECIEPVFGLTDVKDCPKGFYTVRSINNSRTSPGIIGICVYEIINGIHPKGLEYGYKIDRFREIEFPPSIEEEIKECLTRELVEV